MGWVLAGCQETWSHALSNNIQMGHNTLASSHRQSFLRETLKGKVNDLNWISYTFFCASKYSQSRISLWQADKLMSQELGIYLIISGNAWKDLWMNRYYYYYVVILGWQHKQSRHTARAGSSASPFPLGAFQAHSPQCWKIKSESHCFTYFGLIDVAVIIKGAPWESDPHLLYLSSELKPRLIPIGITPKEM